MLKAVMTYMAVDYWDVVDGAGMGFARLQSRLRRERNGNGEEDERMEAEREGVMEFLHIYKE
jgi:hypothetical protein